MDELPGPCPLCLACVSSTKLALPGTRACGEWRREGTGVLTGRVQCLPSTLWLYLSCWNIIYVNLSTSMQFWFVFPEFWVLIHRNQNETGFLVRGWSRRTVSLRLSHSGDFRCLDQFQNQKRTAAKEMGVKEGENRGHLGILSLSFLTSSLPGHNGNWGEL